MHFDPLNTPLLDALPGAVRAGDAVLYPGCGSGLLGLLALRSGAVRVRVRVGVRASLAVNVPVRDLEITITVSVHYLRTRGGFRWAASTGVRRLHFVVQSHLALDGRG